MARAFCAKTDDDMAQKMLTRINSLYESGNYRAALDSIDRMRAVYPDVMRQAQFIVDDCENQKQRVLEYGNNVIKEAESRRDKLLNESDIIRQATEEAAKIKQEAMDMRAHVEYDLKCKIDEVLSDSEVTLRDALTLIRNNREELRKTDGNEKSIYQFQTLYPLSVARLGATTRLRCAMP